MPLDDLGITNISTGHLHTDLIDVENLVAHTLSVGELFVEHALQAVGDVTVSGALKGEGAVLSSLSVGGLQVHKCAL